MFKLLGVERTSVAMKHPNLDMLNKYIKEVKNKPFQWFEHDCLTFTNNAFKQMYGKGWADDWLSKYHKDGEPFKRDKLRKIFNAQTIQDAIDQKLQRINFVPPKGSLVLTDKARQWVIGKAMGISIGNDAIFVSDHGLIAMPIEYITDSWVNP